MEHRMCQRLHPGADRCYTSAARAPAIYGASGGMMGRLILRLVVTAIALFAAIAVVPGVDLAGVAPNVLPPVDTLINLFIVALIFGVVNAIVKPILKGLTCAITFF